MGTLEGLNPEAISPEEDFTSLSEEEEGEIKNYEIRKKLKIKKRELQKKVRELERQVIEISPSRAPILVNGGNLEDGEIHDDKKKKKPKVNSKAKTKVKKVVEGGDDIPKGDDAQTKDGSRSTRNYRKKEDKGNLEDETTEAKVKPKRKKKEKP